MKPPKSPTPEQCHVCGSEMFNISAAGPHRKLSCAECGRYIKFVNPDQETELRDRNKIL